MADSPDSPKYYRGKKTPFLSKHSCQKESYSISATTFHRAYYPQSIVNVGDLAAYVVGAHKIVGEVKAIKSKGRGRFIVFEGKAGKTYACSKCVRLPSINEFVKHKQTGKWSKVTSVGKHGEVSLSCVLADVDADDDDAAAAAPATPSQGTPKSSKKKPDAGADAADKNPAESAKKKPDADADGGDEPVPTAKELFGDTDEEVLLPFQTTCY